MNPLEAAVHAAVASVDDPEYPGLSIVDLGLLEQLMVSSDGAVSIGLIPTFSGCPALRHIGDAVTQAVQSVDNVTALDVVWLATPAWTISRVSAEAKAMLARDFTVAVDVALPSPHSGPRPAPVPCPMCATPMTVQSMFGTSRCRSIHHCSSCSESVEVLRSSP